MQNQLTRLRSLTGGEDIARWLTFSGFWGFVFYLLSFLSLTLAQRRQPFQLNSRPLLTGMLLHVGGFVVLGSAASAAETLRKGKPTSALAQERIAGGSLDRVQLSQGLGAAAGAAVPFGLALGALRAAEQLSGERAFTPAGNTRWPQALGAMALFTGAAALAITRIASWVAKDARRGSLTAQVQDALELQQA